MKRILASSVAVLVMLQVTSVYAAAASSKSKKDLKASVGLGIVVTTGNTRTKNINFKGDVVYTPGHWRHKLHASALNASTKGQTTAERYYATGSSRYNFTKNNYAFGQAVYDNNRFSGFNYLITETLGYGRNLINRPALTLDVEAGGGLRQSRIIATGQTQNEGVAQAAGNLSWNLSDTSTFSEELSTVIGKKRSVSRSVTSLKMQLVGNLAADISYTVQYTSSVPPGFVKSYTQTSVTLVYTF